jgi:hypothetical protein
MTERNVFSRAEFCQRNNLSKTTFYNLVKNKRLIVRKLGHKTVVTVGDEAAFLAALPELSTQQVR